MSDIKEWQFGKFKKLPSPILEPSDETRFICPVSGAEVAFEATNVYNPAAIVKDGRLHIFYRADSPAYGEEGEDPWGYKKVTCRIAHAVSDDGVNFERCPTPAVYPDRDEYFEFEWWGGCGDLHIVEGEDGKYYMNYDAWTGKYDVEKHGFGKNPDGEFEDILFCAVSDDLVTWKKCGPALGPEWKKYWNHSRSGVIVSRIADDGRLIATKIGGKYLMYMSHQGHLAVSDDLISWDLVLDEQGEPKKLFSDEELGGFDGGSHEAGAAAIITERGIVYFYNAMGRIDGVDYPQGDVNVWSQGQALISLDDLTTVIDKTDSPTLYPEYGWEISAHSPIPCLVCNTIVYFNDRWNMYYGGADRYIGLAYTEKTK